MSLANNHLLDYGEGPVLTTLRTLKDNSIQVSGVTYGKLRISEQVMPYLFSGFCETFYIKFLFPGTIPLNV